MDGYQLKISLKDANPPIWRRVVVPRGFTFDLLHQTIQEIFDLMNYHLYSFTLHNTGTKVFGPGVEEDLFINEQGINSQEYLDDHLQVLDTFEYCYDFGDNWQFDIVIEGIVDDANIFPVVIAYRGDGLIEDCGGVDELMEILAGRSDSYDRNDIEEFDVEFTNVMLEVIKGDKKILASKEKEEIIALMERLKDILKQSKIKDISVVEIETKKYHHYYVIEKDIKGYSILVFDTIEALIDGFINIPREDTNHVFVEAMTFFIGEQSLPFDGTLDANQQFVILKNEPGYTPYIPKDYDAKKIVMLLEDIVVGIQDIKDLQDTNASHFLHLEIEDGKCINETLKEVNIRIDKSRYVDSYAGYSIINRKPNHRELYVDILGSEDDKDSEALLVFAVVCDEFVHDIEYLDDLTYANMAKVLIKGIVELCNDNGRYRRVYVGNANIAYMIEEYLQHYDIPVEIVGTMKETELALQEFFAENQENEVTKMMESPRIKSLMKELEGKSEEELESYLMELLTNGLPS